MPSGPLETAAPGSLPDRLLCLDTCALSDAMDSFGISGAITGVLPVGPARRIAGQARTVALEADRGVPSTRHLGTAAIEDSAAGDVIVVAHRSRDDAAGWGGLLAKAALAKGVSAVVVDGVCRDVDDYFEHDLPVWARGATPVSARGRVVEASTGEPVRLGGITVSPGDWIVADRSGVVAIPAGDVERVTAKAEALARREALMTADIRAGRPVTEVLGHDYETMLRS
ncbi:RraA family protein [Amycolatopsis pithecellobii]|uniref:Putative 4-hydroxy-4-methyl-2-oxoglutarate aldolase n=1 Tax=Amycolatopsis pithecellobii TaxID=664692 RepID=A0A6N7Z8S9_9PSEU|nr:RraA family protein [Amycolatopsis pithecellobii]MTD57046.1 RraA family protein [Amycolatopsis pithecellobii]